MTVSAVLTVMGVGTSSTNTFIKDLPMFIALVVLAIFTFVPGLRAGTDRPYQGHPHLPDGIAAVFYILTRPGGWGHIFGTAQTHFAAINPATKKPFGAFVPTAQATGNT